VLAVVLGRRAERDVPGRAVDGRGVLVVFVILVVVVLAPVCEVDGREVEGQIALVLLREVDGREGDRMMADSRVVPMVLLVLAVCGRSDCEDVAVLGGGDDEMEMTSSAHLDLFDGLDAGDDGNWVELDVASREVEARGWYGTVPDLDVEREDERRREGGSIDILELEGGDR